MRKYLVALVLVFLMATLFANQETEKLAKACKAGLAKKDGVLKEKANKIDLFILKTVEDEIVTKAEMITLWNLVRDFKAAKKRFDKELNLAYKMKTTVTLNSSLDKALKEYISNHVFHRRDSDGTVKRFFAIYTGKDVEVVAGYHIGRETVALLICFFLFLVGGLICFRHSNKELTIVFFTLSAGLVTLFFFL